MLTIDPFRRALHARQHVFGAQPGAFQIDGEHRLPLRLGHLSGVEIGVHAGVVDEDVDTLVGLEHPIDSAANVSFFGHVRGNELDGMVLELADGAIRLGRIEIEERHGCALGQKLLDDGAADAARTTGDERDLVSQPRHAPRTPVRGSPERSRGRYHMPGVRPSWKRGLDHGSGVACVWIGHCRGRAYGRVRA